MPTPRRVMLMVLGLLGTLGGYAVYAYFLGSINGLPPLPIAFLESRDPTAKVSAPPEVNRQQRIIAAFGSGCPELRYPVYLEIRAKGLLLAADRYSVTDDGQLQFSHFSLAIFGKVKPGQEYPEINTIHADKAFVEFDQPVGSLADLSSRKIVGARLESDKKLHLRSADDRVGLIHIQNNRRSVSKADDLVLRTPGPIDYRAEPTPEYPGGPLPPHLWTESVVKIVDRQNLPRKASEALDHLPETDLDRARHPGVIREILNGERAPLPTIIAQELRVFLEQASDAEPSSRPTPKQPRPGSITGVARIDFASNVHMNLWVDEQSDFLAGGNSNPPKQKAKLPPNDDSSDKVLIQIETRGAFHYDLDSDKARFEIAPESDPLIPNHVVVTRHVSSNQQDVLGCEILELQFNRKAKDQSTAKRTPSATAVANPKGPPPGDPQHNPVTVQIDWAHAWGKSITIGSDTDQLQAWGNDLYYDARTKRTTLSGNSEKPIVAIKDGNLIEARQLVLNGMDNPDQATARAIGPVQIHIDLIDAATRRYAREARCSDSLIFRRDPKAGPGVDRLEFVGNAEFIDRPGEQQMAAEEITVWLLPSGASTKPSEQEARKLVRKNPDTSNSLTSSGRRPSRVLAVGKVKLDAPDLKIKQAKHLNVVFRDVPEDEMPPEDEHLQTEPLLGWQPPGKPLGKPRVNFGWDAPSEPIGSHSPVVRQVWLAAPPEPAPELIPLPIGPEPPLEVVATQIEAHLKRHGKRHALDTVVCDHQVQVHQDPTDDQPRGIDITGNHLRLTQDLTGNLLDVHGTPEKDAFLRFEKIALVGQAIHVDQRNNYARVKGRGSMDLESNADLQGNQLTSPTTINIAWKDAMEFNGSEQWAFFEGEVQAVQQETRLLCETMHVTMDKPVWFNQSRGSAAKQGKPKESPKIDLVLCDQQPADGVKDKRVQPVSLIEKRFDENGQLLAYQRIEGPWLKLDNLKKELWATGPGTVRILQRGDQNLAGRSDQPKKPNPQGGRSANLKFTWVRYNGQMRANDQTRSATFTGHTEVLHMPGDDPELDTDAARQRVPEGGMWLRCADTLEVSTREGIHGHQWHEMKAKGNAGVRAPDFFGNAEVVKYDESKDAVTFEGTSDHPAKITRQRPGTRGDVIKGNRIKYYRRTGEYEGDGIRALSGS